MYAIRSYYAQAGGAYVGTPATGETVISLANLQGVV